MDTVVSDPITTVIVVVVGLVVLVLVGKLLAGILKVGLILLVLVGVLVAFAGNFQVVRTTEGFRVYPRSSFSLDSPYVDLTGSDAFARLRQHPDLIQRIIEDGDIGLLPGGEILRRAVELGISVKDAVAEFDSEGELGRALEDAASRGVDALQRIDDEYRITDRARDAVRAASERLGEATDSLTPER